MTAVTEFTGSTADDNGGDSTGESFSFLKSRTLRWIIIATAGVLMLSLTEEFARPSTTDLTSVGTWSTALGWSIPIFLAGLGGIYSERSGIVNIGLEGMMILGTWFGAFFTVTHGPWWGMVAAGVAGAAGGLLHALATVTFGVDHIISGVAINIMAPGITRYLASVHFSDRGGSITQSPGLQGLSPFNLPFLAGGTLFGWKTPDILGRIEGWDVFLVSNMARIGKGLSSGMSWFTVLAVALIPGSIYLLWRTPFGLRLRSCGEHPAAADSLGVPVYRYKYYGVVISGLMAGLAGGFLSIQLTGIYKEGQTVGKGFIGLATMIFGNWRPVGTAAGSMLFGLLQTLQLRDRAASHGLLLLVALLVFMLAVRAWYTRGRRSRVQVPEMPPIGEEGTLTASYSEMTRAAALAIRDLKAGRRAAAYLFATSLLFGVWYFTTDNVPAQVPQVTPHVAVLIVLIFASQRLRMPAADGQPYRKGQG